MKGVKNGTYKESKAINQWSTAIRNERKNNRGYNASLSDGRKSNRNVKLYNGETRKRTENNGTYIANENITNLKEKIYQMQFMTQCVGIQLQTQMLQTVRMSGILDNL